ncbi:MAG TPA: helix-hairpin-helix domain-containing protein [Acidimicrobiia bacterium]|nr:helix-hairpin-helix domain-containing protein [Acidimicrobiia bacterium]
MKRLVRLMSFAAAVAAIIWAMRDRFISLALPREPEPPVLRHPEDHPRVPHRPHQAAHEDLEPLVKDDLQEIKGIGPVFAAKLADLGITSFADLAAGSIDELASGLDTTETRISDWMAQARQRI